MNLLYTLENGQLSAFTLVFLKLDIVLHKLWYNLINWWITSFIYLTGCDIGHYGYECLECPSHCINNTCQMQVGHCFDCENGYTGPKCEEGRIIDK